MIIAGGLATEALWKGSTVLQKVIGTAATLAGIGYAGFVLISLLGLVLWQEHLKDVAGPFWWLLVRLVGLGIASVVCGSFGITVLDHARS